MWKKYLILLVLFISLVIFNLPASSHSSNIILGKPISNINVDLITAYQLRKSTKSFLTKEINVEDLSTILWAANGINRENGKRTAPSAYGKYYIDIYVVSDKGVYVYDVPKHELSLIAVENIKKQIARQKYVGEASHIIVLTTNLSKFHPMVKEEKKIPASYATVGFIGQNIYLVANALNLGTAFVVGIKEEVIREKLKLKDDEIPLCVMPIGYPKR
ncbi:MAG: nitroreductase family protein [Deltaproteobacteria bacterium]|nr:nitroreductase family protein [Deltaproteobacteria bacterium]MBW1861141.1 nitroreductase family protein [Deltaproteobacteria bacterium]